MSVTFIKTVEAETEQKKYYAYLNAKTTSAVNATTFSAEAKLEVERLVNFINLALDYAFTIYPTYRKTKATIKIEGIRETVFTKNTMIAAMIEEWKERGYVFTYTPQGLNIGIKK